MKKKRFQKPATPATDLGAKPQAPAADVKASSGPVASATFSVAQPAARKPMPAAAVIVADHGGEPTAAGTSFPVWLLVLLATLLFWGDMFLMNHGGQFSAQVYSPYVSTNQLDDFLIKDPTQLFAARGKKIYNTYCVACHQATGAGAAGQFPPLAGSDWVLPEGPNRIIRVVLNGAAGPFVVNGAQYNNVMVPWRDALSDDDIAAVLTYVRNDWGNKAPAVTPAQVKVIRDATKDKAGSWTMEELKAVSEKD